MKDAALVVAVVLFGCGFLLFLGGMLSAAREIHNERKAGLPVKRPGWRKADREPRPGSEFAYPRGAVWVVYPLLFIGRPDVAERWVARRYGLAAYDPVDEYLRDHDDDIAGFYRAQVEHDRGQAL